MGRTNFKQSCCTITITEPHKMKDAQDREYDFHITQYIYRFFAWEMVTKRAILQVNKMSDLLE